MINKSTITSDYVELDGVEELYYLCVSYYMNRKPLLNIIDSINSVYVRLYRDLQQDLIDISSCTSVIEITNTIKSSCNVSKLEEVTLILNAHEHITITFPVVLLKDLIFLGVLLQEVEAIKEYGFLRDDGFFVDGITWTKFIGDNEFLSDDYTKIKSSSVSDIDALEYIIDQYRQGNLIYGDKIFIEDKQCAIGFIKSRLHDVTKDYCRELLSNLQIVFGV